MFLPLGSHPAEWGVGSRRQCPFNSLVWIHTVCHLMLRHQSLYAAKVCDLALESVLSSVTINALLISSVLNAKVCNTKHYGHQSL